MALVTVLCCVLIPKRSSRVGVAAPTHEFGHARAACRCPGEPAVSEVVQVEVGPARDLSRLVQARLKVPRWTNADPDAVGNSQASGSEPDKVFEVRTDRWHDVCRNRQRTTPRLALRRTEYGTLSHRSCPSALNSNGGVQEVYVSALKSEAPRPDVVDTTRAAAKRADTCRARPRPRLPPPGRWQWVVRVNEPGPRLSPCRVDCDQPHRRRPC